MLFFPFFFSFPLHSTVYKFPVLILLVDFSRLAGKLCMERGSCLTLGWLHPFETLLAGQWVQPQNPHPPSDPSNLRLCFGLWG